MKNNNVKYLTLYEIIEISSLLECLEINKILKTVDSICHPHESAFALIKQLNNKLVLNLYFREIPKITMMWLKKIDNCIISKVPKRLLIYLLTFLD